MIDLEQLKTMSSVRIFNAGDVVIREGDDDDNGMYIILKGSLRICKHCGQPNEILLATLKPGDFFGEMSMFLNEPRTATVVANEDVTVLEINRHNIYAFLKKQPSAAYNIIRSLCFRIQDLNDKLAGSPESPPETAAQTAAFEPELFPEGHKDYDVLLVHRDKLMMHKSFQCPLCLHSFLKRVPRRSKLKLEKTDPDSRPYYTGIEPLHYEVITCPKCWMSAFAATFEKAFPNKERLLYESIARYTHWLTVAGEAPKNMNEVFSGYYLAMLSAPMCFLKSKLVIARLWLRLSWLYSDCGDAEMKGHAITEACKWYLESYSTINIPDDQIQRLHIILGELHLKQGKIDEARQFYIRAITDKSAGNPELKRVAEDRAAEIKLLARK